MSDTACNIRALRFPASHSLKNAATRFSFSRLFDSCLLRSEKAQAGTSTAEKTLCLSYRLGTSNPLRLLKFSSRSMQYLVDGPLPRKAGWNFFSLRRAKADLYVPGRKCFIFDFTGRHPAHGGGCNYDKAGLVPYWL
jgi:hypothetical protein